MLLFVDDEVLVANSRDDLQNIIEGCGMEFDEDEFKD